MVAFGHTAVGALVGLGVYHYLGTSQPEIGLVVSGACGITSHYLADALPHGHFFSEKQFKKKIIWVIIFDFLLSVIVFAGTTLLLNGLEWKFWYVLFAIGGAQLPDVLDGWYYLGVIPHKGIFKIENSFHRSMHWHGIFEKGVLVDGQPLKISDIWQVATVLIALLVLVSF